MNCTPQGHARDYLMRRSAVAGSICSFQKGGPIDVDFGVQKLGRECSSHSAAAAACHEFGAKRKASKDHDTLLQTA